MIDRESQRNIKLVIAYNGAAYHGWQRQAEGVDTVQLRIERAAGRVLSHPVVVSGAGRTDAGVHAEGQVANLYTSNRSVPLSGLRRAMNSALPCDIAVRSAKEVPPNFHASRSAVGKTYRYRIHVSPVRPADLCGQVYRYWRPLDIDRMRDAARLLVGTHDFRGFASSADERLSTVRTIFRCDPSEDGQEIHITVQGSGFLYNMVRIIAGTLIEIGRGRWQPGRIGLILSSTDRCNAGPTAPPDGLTMACVHYKPEYASPDG